MLLTIGWWSCNSAGSDPVVVTKNFVRAIEKRDFAKALEFTTDKFREELKKSMEQENNISEMDADDLRITLIEKDKEYATVAVLDRKERNEPVSVLLKKKAGKWLIYAVEED